MSVTRQVTIWCDACGDWIQETGSVESVHKIAKEKGWWNRKEIDLCPNCKHMKIEVKKNIRSRTFT